MKTEASTTSRELSRRRTIWESSAHGACMPRASGHRMEHIPTPYAGFRAFRGFDGASASFGDTSLQATSSAVQNVVVYASSDSTTPGRVVFVAINRSNAAKVTAITGQVTLRHRASLPDDGELLLRAQSQFNLSRLEPWPSSGSSLTITLPAYSVTTIDIRLAPD